MNERERYLTFQERAVWGVCPACNAKDGEPCDYTVGVPLGMTASGDRPKDGAHLGRLLVAPRKVKEVASD